MMVSINTPLWHPTSHSTRLKIPTVSLSPSISMGTAINNPQRNPNLNPHSIHPRRRKRTPIDNHNNHHHYNHHKDRIQLQDETMIARLRAKNLVNGQVKILKRPQDLKLNDAEANHRYNNIGCGEDLVLSSTERLGPEPETVLKEIRVSDLKVVDVDRSYAGSAAFFASPPPSSLPFPGFGRKEKSFHDSAATSGLRRLLRLDLLWFWMMN